MQREHRVRLSEPISRPTRQGRDGGFSSFHQDNSPESGSNNQGRSGQAPRSEEKLHKLYPTSNAFDSGPIHKTDLGHNSAPDSPSPSPSPTEGRGNRNCPASPALSRACPTANSLQSTTDLGHNPNSADGIGSCPASDMPISRVMARVRLALGRAGLTESEHGVMLPLVSRMFRKTGTGLRASSLPLTLSHRGERDRTLARALAEVAMMGVTAGVDAQAAGHAVLAVWRAVCTGFGFSVLDFGLSRAAEQEFWAVFGKLNGYHHAALAGAQGC